MSLEILCACDWLGDKDGGLGFSLDCACSMFGDKDSGLGLCLGGAFSEFLWGQRRLRVLAASAVTVAQLILVTLLKTIQQPTLKTNKQTMRDSAIFLSVAAWLCTYVRTSYLPKASRHLDLQNTRWRTLSAL